MEWRKSLACALALAGMMAFGPGVRQAALAADTHNLTILGGGSGGLWAIISEGVGETLRRSMPNVRVTTEPGKDGPNQVMTSRGEVQFALATDVLTLKAIKGEAPFKGRKLDNLRLVAVMNPINALQFFVDAKTGAKSIQDIKDKKIPLRITVNRQGTLIDVATEELLKTYGITYSDIAKWGGKVHKIPGPEATDLWDAGQMDAIVEVSQFPTSRFYELGQKHGLDLETGRKNQIRVHMQDLGHPIAGDGRYGGENYSNPIGRLALHAFKLCFYHPVTGDLMEFETPYPGEFKKLFLKK